jgi:hypothetical protein
MEGLRDMADLEVDADQLARDGQQFNNLASIAYSIYGFLAKGAALITFPENDQISRMFAEQWNGLVDGTRTILLGFHDGMSDVATNVTSTAALYKTSNVVNTESIKPPPTIDG